MNELLSPTRQAHLWHYLGEVVALISSKKLQAVRNQTLESYKSSQYRTVAFHQDYREKETVTK